MKKRTKKLFLLFLFWVPEIKEAKTSDGTKSISSLSLALSLGGRDRRVRGKLDIGVVVNGALDRWD